TPTRARSTTIATTSTTSATPPSKTPSPLPSKEKRAMKRLTTAVLIVVSGALLPGGVAAQTDTCPGCRDRTRTCLYRGQRGSVLQAKLPAGLLTYLNPQRRFDGAKGVNNAVSEELARQAA